MIYFCAWWQCWFCEYLNYIIHSSYFSICLSSALLSPTMGASQSSKFHCNRYLNQQGPPSLAQQGYSRTFNVFLGLCKAFHYFFLISEALDWTKCGLLSAQLIKKWIQYPADWMPASQWARWHGRSWVEPCQTSLKTTPFSSTTYSQMESKV